MAAGEATGRAGDYQGAFALLATMTRDFATSLDLDATLDRALGAIAGHVDAEAGSLWLFEQEVGQLACVASVGPHPITGMRLPVNEGIVGRCVRENATHSVLDVSRDPDFSQRADTESGFVTRSLICAPMSFGEQRLGAVQLINKLGGDGRFEPSDAHFLEVLAASAGLAIASARLAQAQVDNERVRRELELAAEIQRGLLPRPRAAPFPVHGVNVPARTVSGDFFDVLPLSRGRIAFCLGDVSGKGMNAALLMAKTASLYRCLVRDLANPGLLLTRLNDEVCETATRGMFVTLAAGVYDSTSGSVRVSNAGHEPPLLLRPDGTSEALPARAPPLGVVPGSPFPEEELELAGGCLYVFSDGLSEARNAEGRQLGARGVLALARKLAHRTLAERIEAMAAAAGRLELRDDLTLLGVSDAERLATAGALLELRFSAEASALEGMREALREKLGELGCGRELTRDLVLAVDEACANVIRHAYGSAGGEIELRLERQGDQMIFSLLDYAPPVDPGRIRPRELDELRPGGLGTRLIQEVMDSAEFVEPPRGAGNLFRMAKRIG